MVPLEPTEEMRLYGYMAGSGDITEAKDIYKAMLSAVKKD